MHELDVATDVPASRGPLFPLLLAAGFLTTIPVPVRGTATAKQLAAALPYFSLVGALLGAILGGLDQLFLLFLPGTVATVLDLAVLALLTGGIHLDALMDTCDGLFGGRTVERRLAIMRDSRVGSFGVIGGVLVLLLQYTALTALPPSQRFWAFVGVLALARWAMVIGILAFPPARPDGLGANFQAQARPGVAVIAAIPAVLAVAPERLVGVALIIVTIVAAVLAGAYICRQVKGLTGDSYGAIGELVTALGFVALTVVR